MMISNYCVITRKVLMLGSTHYNFVILSFLGLHHGVPLTLKIEKTIHEVHCYSRAFERIT